MSNVDAANLKIAFLGFLIALKQPFNESRLKALLMDGYAEIANFDAVTARWAMVT